MNLQKEKKILAVYFVIFYAVWAAFELLFSGTLENALGEVVSGLVTEGLIKTAVWAVPAAVLIKKNHDKMLIKCDRESFRKGWKVFFPAIAFVTLYLLVSKWRTTGKIVLADDFSPMFLLVYLFVGINEEMVFRNWLLNSTAKDNDEQWKPLLINALMFLAIHFPIWIRKGVFLANLTNGGALMICLLSLGFSYSFLKSRNILVPVLLHAWWDFMVVSLK